MCFDEWKLILTMLTITCQVGHISSHLANVHANVVMIRQYLPTSFQLDISTIGPAPEREKGGVVVLRAGDRCETGTAGGGLAGEERCGSAGGLL